MSYDRYSKFKNTDGSISVVPFVPIRVNSSDKFTIYHLGRSRLDKVSYEYYGDANYEWLILQANPTYGFFEFEIPDGAPLRIPFPLTTVLENYEEDIKNYQTLNGTN